MESPSSLSRPFPIFKCSHREVANDAVDVTVHCARVLHSFEPAAGVRTSIILSKMMEIERLIANDEVSS